ncbi:hypothetical protein PTSG_00580 [Salpingoeca rosetta]|uniref:Pre-mRNA-splicing factor ISY1 n=1 Tax=Salpingoeca rosetta (strain ATCC 50818 / BSB-021) TaxID=946362 RepID=F2TWW0_SALR5|nr:uncharacterized protein PTSG_00580 [Salpingoeca rosetta]EGD72556.1 hypothetical protein PTSG_00580 [Salpingoeca rosetta]|eukprot:XP_004999125.1 hypothetical protein PTSG_00580 [Salpingoeca rosetta]
MARNEEKAQSLLSRWLRMKKEEADELKRVDPSQVSTVPEAEKMRNQVMRDVSKKIASIQNAGLGEYRIRDLNDEINKLLRTKRYWENRIKEMGGPDYLTSSARIVDSEGVELPGQRGYKYFGAAKDLPGVRELFAEQPAVQPRRKRGELHKFVDADYYGYRDEEDGVLLALEEEAEEQSRQAAVEKWQQEMKEKKERLAAKQKLELYASEEDKEAALLAPAVAAEVAAMHEEEEEAEPAIPSTQEIEQMILQRRKEMLLAKYASASLQEEEQQTSAMLGRAAQ